MSGSDVDGFPDEMVRRLAKVASEDETLNHSARGWADIVVLLLEREQSPEPPRDNPNTIPARVVVTKAIRGYNLDNGYPGLSLKVALDRADYILAELRKAGFSL